MAIDYDHKAIEKKWQDEWARNKLYEVKNNVPGKKNFYTLVEFPYTSGDLHVGHWYAFAVPDMFARMKRMQGFNVLYPIGFDTFGLPAENAAIKNNSDPAKWTADNIARMRAQLHTLGNAFDWSREVITCEPGYYKWTQWIFLKLLENDLAYRKKALVNWCPKDQTVLANEQVIDGKCERCDTVVEQKELEQWFFGITKYADRLIDDLSALDWPEPIKLSQTNWIGRNEGAELDFDIVFADGKASERIPVFTTRPDTLYGATYMVLAPEHVRVTRAVSEGLIGNASEIQTYVENAKKRTEIERTAEGKEKSGVEIQGIKAINPATKEEIPVFVADYVLAQYGTGAVMGVPAHDVRDFQFANKYSLPIRFVVQGGDTSGPYVGEGLLQNSQQFNGTPNEVAKAQITKAVSGRLTKKYKLRDWLISRQRYWGAPIPIVYDPEGKPHPIPEEHLPWLLPQDVDFTPTGVPPLARSKELLERTENIFGKGWKPETDTMDGFVDNSWYFLRYLDPKNTLEFASIDTQKSWMPIARYSGGAEHTTVHVLYSRFLTKALFDMKLSVVDEPFSQRLNRGLILAEDGRKMSKRWGNVINPDEQVNNVGADAVRTYLAFIGPYNEVGAFPWSTNGLVGVRRFLERVASLAQKAGNITMSDDLTVLVNQSIKKVGDDIEAMKFNTSVSQTMILSNALGNLEKVPTEAYETLLKLLAPFAPHLTEELWHQLGHTSSIHQESWPIFDTSKLSGEVSVVAVQINGKTKGTVSIGRGATEAEVMSAIRNDPKLSLLAVELPTRVIFVPDRVVNLIYPHS